MTNSIFFQKDLAQRLRVSFAVRALAGCEAGVKGNLLGSQGQFSFTVTSCSPLCGIKGRWASMGKWSQHANHLFPPEGLVSQVT